jgi:hypothetical protein
MGRKPKIIKAEKKKYPCMHCVQEKNEDSYYLAKNSARWNYSNNKALICKECVDKLFREYSDAYGGENACAICCAMLDIPFYSFTYRNVADKNPVMNFGMYSRVVQNVSGFKYKSFLNSITEDEFGKKEPQMREITDIKWTPQDIQNMNYANSVVGYDPFDDCEIENNDRRFCFNILAGYCDDDSVRLDNHKLQCVIQMTHMHLQIKKIDEALNRELSNVVYNEKKLKEYSDTKKNMQDSISKISKDNNIASYYNDNSRAGANTLSDKIKEMTENGYEALKVNLFSVKTSRAMKQIADLSNRSILDQLNFDANDYTDMIKEQREMILSLEAEKCRLTEENRVVKNEVEKLKRETAAMLKGK